MNYEYGEPYLEITFLDGEKVRIKKSVITEIYDYINEGRHEVKVYINRVDSTTWYRFIGTMEEFDNHCKTVYI
jgi:hypothetical protein